MEGWPTQPADAATVATRSTLPVQPIAEPRVTILLPAYNEEPAIRSVLEEIVEAMAHGGIPPLPFARGGAGGWDCKVNYEILVVDDASTDRTREIVEQFAAECWHCEVRLVRSPLRRGAGAARKIGVREARGEIVVMLDADGTYPAAHIPEMLGHFPAYDQVNGARTSEQGTLRPLRTLAKWLIRKLACYLTGTHIPDLNTGLKAFKRESMLPWLWVVPDGFSCVTTMTLAFLTNNYAVKYLPIGYRPRIGRSKFHPIKDTWAYLGTVVRIVLYFRPLKVFLPLSGLLIAAGVAKSIWSFLATGSMQESDIVVLTAGFMTCMLGLLAEVIVAHHRR